MCTQDRFVLPFGDPPPPSLLRDFSLPRYKRKSEGSQRRHAHDTPDKLSQPHALCPPHPASPSGVPHLSNTNTQHFCPRATCTPSLTELESMTVRGRRLFQRFPHDRSGPTYRCSGPYFRRPTPPHSARCRPNPPPVPAVAAAAAAMWRRRRPVGVPPGFPCRPLPDTPTRPPGPAAPRPPSGRGRHSLGAKRHAQVVDGVDRVGGAQSRVLEHQHRAGGE